MTSDEVYHTIKFIANLSGDSKQSFLKVQNPEICRYLKAAYNPFVKFGITSKACLSGKGQNQFNGYTWKVLNALAKSELTGGAAIQTVKSHTIKLTPQSSKLFGMILDKNFKMGMGAKSINKVYPGLIPTHDIMLAERTFEPHRLSYPCFISAKIDCVRGVYKNGVFYSRGGHPYHGLDHIIKELQKIGIKYKIDGELAVDAMGFQKGSGEIRNYNATPNAIFYIFDMPDYKVPFIERLIAMEDIANNCNNVIAIPHLKCRNLDEIKKIYSMHLEHGYEGSVVKPWDYEYVGKRTFTWMKLKPKETVDLKVVDLYEGKGKYEGQMGGAIVIFKGKPNRVGGGWSDKQREHFWNNMDELCGKTIEIAYMEETDDGNMRHARFKCFRPDKD
jgi:DNA ligase-1